MDAKALRQLKGSSSSQKCPSEGGKALRGVISFIGLELLFHIQKYIYKRVSGEKQWSLHNPTFQKQTILGVSIFSSLDTSKYLNDAFILLFLDLSKYYSY